MSDKTGRPLGDRLGRPSEHRNSETQIRTLLDNQTEQIFVECQARIHQHKLQEVRAEKDQQLLQGHYYNKIWNYVKLIKEVSLKLKS